MGHKRWAEALGIGVRALGLAAWARVLALRRRWRGWGLSLRHCGLGFGFRVYGSGIGVEGYGLKLYGVGFLHPGLRDRGIGFRTGAQRLGIGVWIRALNPKT